MKLSDAPTKDILAEIAKFQRAQRRAHADHAIALADDIGKMLAPLSTFEHKGRTFRVNFERDDDAEPPWDQGDGRGIVSDWTARDKRPGERLLHADGRSKRYFDFAGTVAKARTEGWDSKPYNTGTKGEQAARAAEAEYEFLRLWCADQWEYLGVTVTMLDSDGEDTSYTDSVWGVESFADYHQEVACDCADECIAERNADIRTKAKETRERNYWAARDVVTRT